MKLSNIFKRESKTQQGIIIKKMSNDQLEKIIGGAEEGVGTIPMAGGALAGADYRDKTKASDASAGKGA